MLAHHIVIEILFLPINIKSCLLNEDFEVNNLLGNRRLRRLRSGATIFPHAAKDGRSDNHGDNNCDCYGNSSHGTASNALVRRRCALSVDELHFLSADLIFIIETRAFEPITRCARKEPLIIAGIVVVKLAGSADVSGGGNTNLLNSQSRGLADFEALASFEEPGLVEIVGGGAESGPVSASGLNQGGLFWINTLFISTALVLKEEASGALDQLGVHKLEAAIHVVQSILALSLADLGSKIFSREIEAFARRLIHTE